MNFGKKGLKLASVLMGTMLMGGVLAGCGSQADSNEIKVGANFEMTGNVANYGSATLDGLKLAIDEINDAGGVDGKKITLVTADNKSEASEAVNAATGRYGQQGPHHRTGCHEPGRHGRERQGQAVHLPQLLHRSAAGHGHGEVCFREPQG